jgi:hypothetical protein
LIDCTYDRMGKGKPSKRMQALGEPLRFPGGVDYLTSGLQGGADESLY